MEYQVGGTVKTRTLESELHKELDELEDEIGENELAHGVPPRPLSTLATPRSIEYFTNERALAIKKSLEVTECHPLLVQADQMMKESKVEREFTLENISLILHQFFLDRIRVLSQCKHSHAARWRRFCEQSQSVEQLYPFYQKRLQLITQEYNDATARMRRLAVVRDYAVALQSSVKSTSSLDGSESKASTTVEQERALAAVSVEDLFLYLRWLLTNMHAQKRFQQFYRLVEYYPMSKQSRVTPEQAADEEDTHSRISSASFHAASLQDELASGAEYTAASKAAARDALANEQGVPEALEQFSQTCNASFSLPLHTNTFANFRAHVAALCTTYGVAFDVQAVRTPGDEMELYGAVCGRFGQLFALQHDAGNFTSSENQRFYAMDSWRHALRRECNWLPFVALRAEPDGEQLAMLTKLRTENVLDDVLLALSRFVKVRDAERALVAMRSHASKIYFVPDVTSSAAQTSASVGVGVGGWTRAQRDALAIWKEIYTSPALALDKSDAEKEELKRRATVTEKDLAVEVDMENRLKQSRHAIGTVPDESNDNRTPSARGSRAPSARQSNRKDSSDNRNTMQMLGLDDGDQGAGGDTMLAGGLLTYLILRYLRIRDLRRSALSVLNYFRSVQRTLTINDCGLSLQSGKQKRRTLQCHRVLPGGAGLVAVSSEVAPGGLASCQNYLFNSCKDYAVAECEFMDFQEAENQDDLWTIVDGLVHVQDQKGYFIMYDAALNDLDALESDLLLVATHFIKDKRVRQASYRGHKSNTNASPDAHYQVDRFSVLYDMWSLESEWLHTKMKLLDCYLEAYQHSLDRDERRRLAQVMTNVMHRRPRIDYKSSYFAKSYRAEIKCLRLHTELVKSMLDRHITEQREYASTIFDSKALFEKPKGNETISATLEGGFGLPYKTVPMHAVSLNTSRPTPHNVYLLEFHPSLGAVARLPEVLKYAFIELCHLHRPASVTASIILEMRLLQEALTDWRKLPEMGYAMSATTHKDIFATSFIENPNFVCQILVDVMRDHEERSSLQSPEERHVGVVETVCRIMETLTLRNRLMEASWQTEILSDCYRKLAIETGHEECHLFMRFVQFEFAKHRDIPRSGQPSSVFVSGPSDEEGADRYVPNFLSLAIHELDESQVGRISFKNKDTLMNILMTNGGLDNLQTIVRAQIVHKNAILSAILHHHNAKFLTKYRREKALLTHFSQQSEVKNDRSSFVIGSGIGLSTQNTSLSTMDIKAGSPSKANVASTRPTVLHAESFVSIQLEKTPLRNMMMNDFLVRKEAIGTLLKNPEELERLKRSLINEFCARTTSHFSQFALRAQIMAYYAQIVAMIDRFPGIRGHFQFSDADRRTPLDDMDASFSETRVSRRPRRVLSQNGKNFVNLWYVPNWAELIQLHRNLPITDCLEALHVMCIIVGCLHDILAYLVAFAQLGNLQNQSFMTANRTDISTHRRDVETTAEWGGAEGIEAVLREIQKQIESLPKPDNPQLVADFLLLRRNTIFLEFESCLRHSVSELLLASGNEQAFLSINATMSCGLRNLSNAEQASVYNGLFELPVPFSAQDALTETLFPLRALLARHGPFPISYWSFKEIERNVKLCVAGLRNMERRIANGELLGLRLLLEDTLQNAARCNFLFGRSEESEAGEHATDQTSAAGSQPETERLSKCVTLPLLDLNAYAHIAAPHFSGALNFVLQPIDSLRLIRWYLVTWKRMEIFKQEWGKGRMMLERIDNVNDYKEYLKLYRAKVYQPVLGSLALKYGQPDLYEGILAEEDILPLPKGCTDFEVKAKELIRLVEDFECFMLGELKKRVSREINHVLAERARDEATMPTDLWKKPTIKEAHTFARNSILENFVHRLDSNLHTDKARGLCRISERELDNCLAKLGNELLNRERESYENYSTFYENLLAQQQALLVRRETEGRVLREQIRLLKQANTVDVQLELADRNYSLLLEVTALRAKIAEMRENSLHQEREIRERVKNDYTKLVHDLFALAFDNRTQFDAFREDSFKNVNDVVTEAKKEAFEKVSGFREKFNSLDEELAKLQSRKNEEIRRAQTELNDTHRVMVKTKNFQSWKQAFLKEDFKKQLAELQRRCDRYKIDYTEIKLLAEEDAELLRQEQTALRNSLSSLEVQCTEMQTQLDNLLKEKRERQYSDDQQAVARRQLKKIKQDNMDKLMVEIDDKNTKLSDLQTELVSGQQQREMNANALEQSIAELTKRLQQERSLKAEAQREVEHLRSQLNEYNDFATSPNGTSSVKARVRSAVSGSWSVNKSDRCKSAVSASTSSVWPASSAWTQKTTVTHNATTAQKTDQPLNGQMLNATGSSAPALSVKLRRPRTVSSKLRFADQPELQPTKKNREL